jgi:hypothetical protein
MGVLTRDANANSVVTTGWTTPTNAYADDAAYATAAPAKNLTVNSDFGFADVTSSDIPNGALIASVQMTMKVKTSVTTANMTEGVQGMDNGAASGSEATRTGNTVESTITATLSGVTLADLRSASTTLKARVRSSKGSTNTAYTSSLNYVSLVITWFMVGSFTGDAKLRKTIAGSVTGNARVGPLPSRVPGSFSGDAKLAPNIQLRGAQASNNGAATSPSLTLTAPSGVVDGDVLVMAIDVLSASATAPMLSPWVTQASQPFGTYGVPSWAYGGGLFVAVLGGNPGFLSTSPDGVVWTPRTHPFSELTYDTYVAYNGGLWVLIAMTYTAHRQATSSDGIVWTEQTNTLGGTSTYNGCLCVSGGGTWLVGQSPVRKSTDGVTFAAVASDPGAYGRTDFATAGSGIWVSAGGYYRQLLRSVNDGDNWAWVDVATCLPMLSSTETIKGVAYGAGTFVAVTDRGHIITSADGSGTWAVQTNPLAAAAALRRVSFADGLFVIIAGSGAPAEGGQYATSPDGVTWTAMAAAVAGVGDASPVYGGGVWLQTGGGGLVNRWAPDYVDWTLLDSQSIAGSAGAAEIQYKYGNTAGATTLPITFTAKTQPNGCLVAHVSSASAGVASISGGGTWSLAENTPETYGFGEIWICPDAQPVSTVTITFDASTAGLAILIEFDNVLASPLDTVNNLAGTSTAPATGSVTPTTADNLVVGMDTQAGSPSSGATGGFIERYTGPAAGRYIESYYLSQRAATARSTSSGTSTSTLWNGAIAALKAGGTLRRFLYWRVAQGGAPASYRATFDGNRSAAGVIVALSGADATAPVAAQYGGQTNASSATVTAPALGTWAASDGIDVGLFTTLFHSSFTPPTSYTEPANSDSASTPTWSYQSGVTTEGTYRKLTSATTVGSIAATAANAAVNVGHHVWIAQAVPPSPPSGDAVMPFVGGGYYP